MNSKSKLIIEIIGLILALILMVVLVFLSDKIQSSSKKENNNITNEIGQNTQLNNTSNNSNTAIENSASEKKLAEVTDTNTYFLLKQCVESYYGTLINEQDLGIIDNKAKKEVDIEKNEILSYSYIPMFNIDKIYVQEIDENQDIYVVYYRVQNNDSNCKQSAIMIRMNKNSKGFSVFPYEYLEKNNYLNLKENDSVSTKNFENIEQDKLYSYNEQSDVDTAKYITELFDRYKFDLSFDNKNLYNTINEEYRNQKVGSFEEFQNYINSKKSELSKEQLKEYKKTVYESYTKLVGSTNQNRNYVFMVKNIMDYSISFDEYSVVTQESKDEYDLLLSSTKARVCIDRVMEAINNKDYDFVYDRLNVILKNNYYRNEQDFIKFVNNNFFENNLYEIQDDYMQISEEIYQFDVKTYNADADEITNNWFKFSITLKDDAEFTVSIVKK